MTELLQKAMSEIAKLDDVEQDRFARWLLELLDDEQRWDDRFAASQDLLVDLATAALDEFEHGETEDLDPDTL